MGKLFCYFGFHDYNDWKKLGAFLNKKGILLSRRCKSCESEQVKKSIKNYKAINALGSLISLDESRFN